MTTTNYKHPTPHRQLHTSACPQATTPDYPGWVTPQPLEHHQRVTTCWCVVLLPWPPSLLRTPPMSHDNSLVCCSRVHDNPLSATGAVLFPRLLATPPTTINKPLQLVGCSFFVRHHPANDEQRGLWPTPPRTSPCDSFICLYLIFLVYKLVYSISILIKFKLYLL